MTKFQTAYSKALDIGTDNKEPSKTKQSLATEANINHIVKRHMKTGTLADLNKLEGIYGEITAKSLEDAYMQVQRANEAFEQIPSNIRKQFGNNPGDFIDFATDPANIKQMQEWGLAKPPQNQDAKSIPAAPMSEDQDAIPPANNSENA